MRMRLAFLFLALFSLFSVGALGDTKSDSLLRAKIVGRWQELRELGCETHQQVMYMRSDGTFQVDGIIRSCESAKQFVWRGTWRVQDGLMKYRTTFSSPKDLFPLGEELADTIISVSSTEWVMREESTGNESHAFRVK